MTVPNEIQAKNIARACIRELKIAQSAADGFSEEDDALTDKSRALVFKAGKSAYDEIRRHGFSEETIGTIVGASGGAKWLVLS